MKYTRLGNSGLEVSRLCLGCMGFGNPDKWSRGEWILKEEESKKVIKKAIDLGVNFFDTADVYSLGESERILGKAIKEYADREEVVIATKVFSSRRKEKWKRIITQTYFSTRRTVIKAFGYRLY